MNGKPFAPLRTLAALTLSLPLLAGCLDAPTGPAPRPGPNSATGGIKLHLTPPPATRGDEHKAINKAYVDWIARFRHDTVEQRLLRKCGGFTAGQRPIDFRSPYDTSKRKSSGTSPGKRIAEARRLRERLPKTLECWTANLPAISSRRAEEYAEFDAYLNALSGDRGVLYKVVKEPIYAIVPKAREGWVPGSSRPSYESELKAVKYTLDQYPTYNSSNLETISRSKATQKENRESWARAANSALQDAARDNPFNRPPPGSQFARRTADAYPGVSASLDAMDRSVFGDAAMNRVLAQSARSYRPGTARSGSALTLDACASVSKTDVNGKVHSDQNCTNDATRGEGTRRVDAAVAAVASDQARFAAEKAARDARQAAALAQLNAAHQRRMANDPCANARPGATACAQ